MYPTTNIPADIIADACRALSIRVVHDGFVGYARGAAITGPFLVTVYGVFQRNSSCLDYPEGYLAMEVRIFRRPTGPSCNFKHCD